MMRAALVGLAVLLTSAASTWLFLSSEGKGPAAPRSSSLSDISETVETTEPTLPTSEVVAALPEPSTAVAAPAAAVVASAAAAPHQKRYEQAAQIFTRQLAAERQDIRWTREIRDTVDEMLRRAEFEGSSVRSAACGNSFCKVEIDHGSEIALYEFLENARGMAGDSDAGGMAYRDRSEGELRTVIYVARPGEELPRVW
jgi:hypothetical protein